MPEVIGRIENMEEKQAANGGTYTVVDIKGEDQGYFDWDGCVVAAEAKVGDTVRIEHSGGKYPRIKGVEKLDQGKGGKEETNNNSARTVNEGSGVPAAELYVDPRRTGKRSRCSIRKARAVGIEVTDRGYMATSS